MDVRVQLVLQFSAHRIPRTRGDEPLFLQGIGFLFDRIPRTRGDEPDLAGSGDRTTAVFPAHVGM